MKIIECLQYLGRQGLAFQGHTDDESNFCQLVKLRAKDDPAITKWMQRRNNTYTSHDIQNEICSIMSHQVLKGIVKEVGENMFSIIADEYTDLSNKEQLTLCLRWIDGDFEAHELVICSGVSQELPSKSMTFSPKLVLLIVMDIPSALALKIQQNIARYWLIQWARQERS
jgi:hypothetical protein